MTDSTPSSLIPPCGGRLVDLTVSEEIAESRKAEATHLPSMQISERSLYDLELLATGAFSPLNRFMGKDDYQRVLDEMRLSGGHLFPIPVSLTSEGRQDFHLDRKIALRNSRNELLALMMLEEIYEWDLKATAEKVFQTLDPRHPLVSEMHRWGSLNLSGTLELIRLPKHYDFQNLRLTPKETRRRLDDMGRRNVVAFQTRNPLHRAHEEMTRRAAEEHDAVLLLHPAVGMTKPGDVDHYTRVRTYRTLADNYYDHGRVLLALLPLAMRMAGPREALWHALIRRNYGANYLIVGRDHASPGVDSKGKPFYQPQDAQDLTRKFASETGVGIVAFQEMVYLTEEGVYQEVSRVPKGAPIASISGTEVREKYLNAGVLLPSWFTRPEVAGILSETYPPRHRQGACLWFTGLSGAGKSTTAEVLTVLLQEHGRQVTVLDGDVVRTHLSKGLGFSREDRDSNIHRIGFVASEIVRHGGVVICAAVSPYSITRNEVRAMMPQGQFIEIFVDTPLEICEQRDTKGMYARARRGEIRGFTGIDDPYEAPEHPEMSLDTVSHSPEENARKILTYLSEAGFVRSRA